MNEASAQLKLASHESAQNSTSSFSTIFQKTRESSVGVFVQLSDSKAQLESILDEARIDVQQCNVSVRIIENWFTKEF